MKPSSRPGLRVSRERAVPAGVVADDRDDGEVVADCGVDFHGVHAHGAIAVEDEDLLVGFGELGADAVREADAHGAGDARVEPVARFEGGDGLPGVVENLVAVHAEDGVTIEELPDFLADTQGMDGAGIGVEEGGDLFGALVVDFAEADDPGGLEGAGEAGFPGFGLRDHLGEGELGVGDDTESNVPVVADFAGFDVDLDDFGVGAEALAVVHHPVEAGADYQDNVGLPHGGAAGAGEGDDVVLRDDAAGHGGGVEGDVGDVNEAFELGAGAGRRLRRRRP